MYIESGEGVYVCAEGEIPISGSTLIYNPPGRPFGYYSSKANLMHAFGMNFFVSSVSNEMEKWIIKDIEALPFEYITHIYDSEKLVKYFTDLSNNWNILKVNYNMKCRSIFLNILLELDRQINKSKDNYKMYKTIEIAISFIRTHYMENITLDNISTEVNLTPSYFGKLFREFTGKTPFEYLHMVRIEKSEELLAIGSSVTKASEMVGFNDPFYFSKVFKKIKGVSPREYMKNPSSLL